MSRRHRVLIARCLVRFCFIAVAMTSIWPIRVTRRVSSPQEVHQSRAPTIQIHHRAARRRRRSQHTVSRRIASPVHTVNASFPGRARCVDMCLRTPVKSHSNAPSVRCCSPPRVTAIVICCANMATLSRPSHCNFQSMKCPSR